MTLHWRSPFATARPDGTGTAGAGSLGIGPCRGCCVNGQPAPNLRGGERGRIRRRGGMGAWLQGGEHQPVVRWQPGADRCDRLCGSRWDRVPRRICLAARSSPSERPACRVTDCARGGFRRPIVASEEARGMTPPLPCRRWRPCRGDPGLRQTTARGGGILAAPRPSPEPTHDLDQQDARGVLRAGFSGTRPTT